MRPLPRFRRMVIVGVGLIGGSLALICKEKGIASEIIGVGRGEKNLQDAVALNVIDRYTLRIEDAVKDVDIVVLATPVRSLLRLATEMSPYLSPGTIITDVGSVKGLVVKIEDIIPPTAYFIGGHPIAGKERSGVEAASSTIFLGAKCILTPTSKTNPEALSTIQAIWEATGAQVIHMDPVRHDLIFAAVSHLPHIVAYALVNCLLDIENAEKGIISYSVGGFRDFTRIAASHPEMWRDICLMNRGNIIRMIERYEEALGKLKSLIESEDADGLYKEFERAKEVREKL